MKNVRKKSKRILTAVLTLALLLCNVMKSTETMTALAANNTFTISSLRLFGSTATGAIEYSENSEVDLSLEVTSLATGHKNDSDIPGTFKWSYKAEKDTAGNWVYMGETEIGNATREECGFTNGSNNPVSRFTGTINMKHYETTDKTTGEPISIDLEIGDKILFYVEYIPVSADDFYGQSSNNQRSTIVRATSKVTLTLSQSSIPYEQEDTVTATANVIADADDSLKKGRLVFSVTVNKDGTETKTEIGTVRTTDGTGSIEIPASTVQNVGIGDYGISVTYIPDNNNIRESSDADTLTVTPRKIIVMARDVTVKLGADLPTSYETIITYANTDKLVAAPITATVTNSVTDTTVATENGVLTPSVDESQYPNYIFEYVNGIFKVVDTNVPPVINNIAGMATAPTNTPNEITFKVSDTETPAEKLIVEVTDKDGNPIDVTGPDAEGNCSFTPAINGGYTITVTDEAGESNTRLVLVDYIDTSSPDAPQPKIDPESAGKPTRLPVSVTIEKPSDNGNEGEKSSYIDVDYIYIKDSNGSTLEKNEHGVYIFTTDTNGTYEVIAVDLAGNESAPTAVVIDNIDKTPPTASADPSAPEAPGAPSKVIITPADPNGDDTKEEYIGVVSVKVDGTEVPKDENGNYIYEAGKNKTYTLTVTDKSGNKTTTTFTVNNILPPVSDITVEYYEDGKKVNTTILKNQPIGSVITKDDLAGYEKEGFTRDDKNSTSVPYTVTETDNTIRIYFIKNQLPPAPTEASTETEAPTADDEDDEDDEDETTAPAVMPTEPTEPTMPTEPETTMPNPHQTNSAPFTADHNSPTLWLMILAVSTGAGIYAGLFERKRHTAKKD